MPPRSTTTTIVPDQYRPAVVSAGLVTYDIPAGNHTIAFTSTASCWIGIERSSNGPYLWMDTIGAGGTATYAASSNVVVRIGAPSALSVSVDGVPVVLPKGQTQPFDVALGRPVSNTTTS